MEGRWFGVSDSVDPPPGSDPGKVVHTRLLSGAERYD